MLSFMMKKHSAHSINNKADLAQQTVTPGLLYCLCLVLQARKLAGWDSWAKISTIADNGPIARSILL